MSDRRLFVLSLFKMPRAFSLLATLLLILSLLGGITLYREVRDRSREAETALKNQIAQTLKANANSLKFIENKGQWPADVFYALESATGAVWIRKDDIFFRAVRRIDKGGEGVEPRYDAHNWTMTLAGMNRNFKVRQGEPQPTIYNYFIDNDHMTSGVRSFKEVTLEGIYPGIDLRFYSGEKQRIEYDFIVAPGADYRQIKMDYEGQDFLRTGDDNTLEIGLSFDTIKTSLPEVYQVRDGAKVRVEMAFRVDGNRAGFETESPIDPTLALVIDPTLLFGTYFENTTGTNFDGYAYAGKANLCGEVYVGGMVNLAIDAAYTTSTGQDTTIDTTTGSAGHAVLYRFNAAGTDVLNFTYFGSGADSLQGSTFLDIDLFPDGRVIAVGRAQGTIPVTGGAYQAAKGTDDGNDVTGVIAVFNDSLTTLHYASYLGGADPDNLALGDDAVRCVITAGNNAYYVGGSIEGAPQVAGFVNAGGPDTTITNAEGYIARFSGASYNTRDWAVYVGGNDDDHVFSLAITPDQTKLVFTGWIDGAGTEPDGFPTPVNAVDIDRDGDECFVGWLASVATAPTAFGMLSYIGGSTEGGDDQRPLVTANNLDLFVAFSSNTDDIPGEITLTSPTGFNVVLSRIDLDGTLAGNPAPHVVTQYRGGNGVDTAGGVVLNAAGELLVFASTDNNATNYPTQDSVPPSAFFDSSQNGDFDIVFNFFTGSDTLPTIYSGFVGGTFDDYLGDTGVVQGGGHYDYNPTTGVVTLATTVHSILPGTVVPGPGGLSFDSTKNAPGEGTSEDSHLVLKFATEVTDYGDAPLSYDGALATAARHVVGESPTVVPYARLGTIIDVDPTLQSSLLCQADDNNATTNPCAPGGDDKDGLTFPAITNCTLPGSFCPDRKLFQEHYAGYYCSYLLRLDRR